MVFLYPFLGVKSSAKGKFLVLGNHFIQVELVDAHFLSMVTFNLTVILSRVHVGRLHEFIVFSWWRKKLVAFSMHLFHSETEVLTPCMLACPNSSVQSSWHLAFPRKTRKNEHICLQVGLSEAAWFWFVKFQTISWSLIFISCWYRSVVISWSQWSQWELWLQQTVFSEHK